MKEIRRLRLKKLLESPRFAGNKTKLWREAGISSGRLTQLLDEAEPFGDLAATNLATALGLPGDYFNAPEEATESPPEHSKTAAGLTTAATELALLYDLIPEADRVRRASAYSGASRAILDALQTSA
jgi:hypothetical protein